VADLRDRKTQLARQRAELSAEGKVPNEKMLEHLNEQEKVLDQEITGAMNAAKAVNEAHQARLAEQEARASDAAELERQKQTGRLQVERAKEKEGSKVKDSELRQQLKEVYGLSEYLLTTMNPELRARFNEASRIAAHIANNPAKFGLPADARSGAIAAKAKELEEVMSGVPPQERPPIQSFSEKP
jgi:hypothetical protein